MAYRISRNLEASLIDFLTTNFNADWSNVNIEKAFARVYDIALPTICVRANNVTHDKAEIGGDSTIRTVQVFLDIFASSDGQKLDFTDYIVEKIKGGCVYYDFVISGGIVESKTANGRIRVTDINVTPIDFNTDRDKLDIHDRFRSLITLEISLGRVEA